MAEEQIQILKKFPLLIPNNNFTEYEGCFSVGPTEMYLRIMCPRAPALADMKIMDCSWDLQLILLQYSDDIDKVSLNQRDTEVLNTVPVKFWESLFEDLKTIGYDKVKNADSKDLSWIDLKVTDQADRDHLMRVNLSTGLPQFEINLPEEAKNFVLMKESIVSAYYTFQEHVLKLQQFWNCMEEVDSQCWILDPPDPGLADTKRQIAIGHHLRVNLFKDCITLTDRFCNSDSDLQDRGLKSADHNRVPSWAEITQMRGKLPFFYKK